MEAAAWRGQVLTWMVFSKNTRCTETSRIIVANSVCLAAKSVICFFIFQQCSLLQLFQLLLLKCSPLLSPLMLQVLDFLLVFVWAVVRCIVGALQVYTQDKHCSLPPFHASSILCHLPITASQHKLCQLHISCAPFLWPPAFNTRVYSPACNRCTFLQVIQFLL